MQDRFEKTPFWLIGLRCTLIFLIGGIFWKLLYSRGIMPDLYVIIFIALGIAINFFSTIGPAGIVKVVKDGVLYIDEDTFRDYVYKDLLPEIPDEYLAFKYRIVKAIMAIYAHSTEADFNRTIALFEYRKTALKNEVLYDIESDIKNVDSMIEAYSAIDNVNTAEIKHVKFAYVAMTTALEEVLKFFKDKLPTNSVKMSEPKFYTPVGTFDYSETSMNKLVFGCATLEDAMQCMSSDTIFEAEISKLKCMKSLLESELNTFKDENSFTDSKYCLRYVTGLQKWVEDMVDNSQPTVWRNLDE